VEYRGRKDGMNVERRLLERMKGIREGRQRGKRLMRGKYDKTVSIICIYEGIIIKLIILHS
jgi:hypothetical protein